MRPPDPPTGWTPPSNDDREFCLDRYLAPVPDLSRPRGVLPDGFSAYTAVLHRLGDASRSRWITGLESNLWRTVQDTWERDIAAARWECDVALAFDLVTARALRAVLLVTAAAGPFVTLGHTGMFAGRSVHELTGDAFIDWFDHLDDRDMYSTAGQLCVWFPNDRRWVASAPIDMGITYIASDQATADRILAHPDLEALACLLP